MCEAGTSHSTSHSAAPYQSQVAMAEVIQSVGVDFGWLSSTGALVGVHEDSANA